MKSNDNLLCHIVATDEMLKGLSPKYKTDEIVHNPSRINVAANEVIYLHFFHCDSTDFNIEIATPTFIQQLTPKNTFNGSNNTIIRAIGNVNFKATQDSNFYVQFLKIYY